MGYVDEMKAKFDALHTQLAFGPPTASGTCADKQGHFAHYDTKNVSLFWSPTTGAHVIYGYIRNKYAAMGFERGPQGYPTTDELDTSSGRGRFNNMQGGTLIWRRGTTEAFAVYGWIYDKWGQTGWDTGFLGFPTTDEGGCPDGVGRFNHFEGGSIYWTPNLGAHVVTGAIRDAWAAQGWETGSWGYPTSDGIHRAHSQTVHFQGATVSWDSGSGLTVTPVRPIKHLRIYLDRGHCGNTEDVTGADDLYLVGGAYSRPHTSAFITAPLSVNDDDEFFFQGGREVFEFEVPDNEVVNVWMQAFDADAGNWWPQHEAAVQKAADSISSALKNVPDPRAQAAGVIAKVVPSVFGAICAFDKDDSLGTYAFDVPATGPADQEINWHFKQGGLGYSTWNYNVIVKVRRS